MVCRKCGKEIPDDSEFCPKCGAAIEKKISEQVKAQTAATAASAPDASPVTYSASETQTSGSVNAYQAVLAETKPGRSNKPIIITVTIAVIATVLAAIIIPLAVSQNNKAHRGSDQHYQEIDKDPNAVIPGKEFEIVLKDDNTYMISKYLGTDPNVIIPAEIDGKPVSEIGERAFSGSSVESITIGENVWEIGEYAFSNCRSLRSVEILPNDDFVIDIIEGNILINSIGDSAFEGCSSLETFIFPYNNYSEIGSRAFYQCSALKSVELTGIRSVGEKAFSESGLQSVNLHTGETKPAVFANCKNLKEVTLGNLVDISDEMFSGCTSLETVTWNFSPYMDNEIGSKAFYGCASLKRFNTIDTPITYPQGFSEFIEKFRELGAKDIVIGEDAFKNCKNFTDPEIPKITFTTFLNSDGYYEDSWSYVFYDDPNVHGKWETVGVVWAEELEDWKKGNAQIRTDGKEAPWLAQIELFPDGKADLTLSKGRQMSAVWSNGYVCHDGLRAPSVSEIFICTVNGTEYLVFEYKGPSYYKQKLVGVYFILERNNSFTDIPDTPSISDPSSRSALDISQMTYADIVRSYGEPDWYMWETGKYENMEIGYSFDKYTGRECFTTSNNDRIKHVVLKGGKETMINDKMHLGEGFDYYNNFLNFDLYDALELEYGLGEEWYKVGITFSNSGVPIYNVDLRFSTDDEICYAAKVTYLR